MNEADVKHHTQSHPTRTPAERLVTALTDPDRLFTPVEVAYLMSVGTRWGYENAMAELEPDPLSWHAGYAAGCADTSESFSAGYPPPPYLIVQGIRVRGDQAVARAAADADRTQRYAGGPVAAW